MAHQDTRALVAHLFRRAGFGLRPDELDHFTRLGVQGSVEYLIDYEIGPSGERFTCRNQASGALVSVSRPRRWTEDEERRFVDALDEALNGDDALAELDDPIDWMPADRQLVTC